MPIKDKDIARFPRSNEPPVSVALDSRDIGMIKIPSNIVTNPIFLEVLAIDLLLQILFAMSIRDSAYKNSNTFSLKISPSYSYVGEFSSKTKNARLEGFEPPA